MIDLADGLYGEATARAALAPLGLPFVEQAIVDAADDAVAALAALGGRVVLKAATDEVVHKSDAGLVILGLEAADDVRAAYDELLDRAARAAATDGVRVAVQAMAPDGIDLFVGVERDPTFGPVVLVGFGGVTVELDADVARRLPPIDRVDAVTMVRSLRRFPLLDGFRGGPVFGLDAFADVVAAVAELAATTPVLQQLDLNPVRVLPDGRVVILDARLAVSAVARPAPAPPPRPLEALFAPSSVAIVGASRDPSRPGGRVVAYLQRHGYKGTIHLVNPAGGVINGLPVHESLAALPEVPELVCSAVGAAATVDVVRQARAAGVGAVVAFASGFAEAGPDGAALEVELAEAASDGDGNDLVLCGPNTIGVVNVAERFAGSFSQVLEVPALVPGPVAFISQSGAVGGSLLSREIALGYGFSRWVTVGNETCLTVTDYLEHLVDQDDVGAIAIFLEGVGDGDGFRAALGRAREQGRPVVVFKTGVTDEGAAAVRSHSAVLAGSPAVYAAALAQSGAIEVDEMTALLETAYVLAGPKPIVDGVAVVTTSGGAGSVTADLLVGAGLSLAPIGEPALAEVRAALPGPAATVANPFDVTAEGAFTPGTIEAVVGAVADDPAVGTMCVVLTALAGDSAVRVAREIARAARRTGVPVLVTWLLDPSLMGEGRAELVAAGIRVFDEPARMVRAVQALVEATR